jgi:hypothetical protein
MDGVDDPTADEIAEQVHSELRKRAGDIYELPEGALLARLNILLDEVRSDDPLSSLSAIRSFEQWLRLREFESVKSAHDAGVPFQAVADELGLSLQTIVERYGYLDPGAK